MMQLETRQFGFVEVQEKDVIEIPRGLLGFEAFERFVFIDSDECEPFRWLQSCDAPDLSFVVVSPVAFFPEYRVAVHAKEVADIGVQDPHDVEIFVIVTIPEQFEKMSANLQGPILVNSRNGKAKQLVLTNSEYTVQHLILDELNRRVPATAGSRTTMELT
jgi:flagellar assembly factor FliW